MSIGWNQPAHAANIHHKAVVKHGVQSEHGQQTFSNRSVEDWNGFHFFDGEQGSIEGEKPEEEQENTSGDGSNGQLMQNPRVADSQLQRRASALMTKLICFGRRISQRSVHVRMHHSTSSLDHMPGQQAESRVRFCEIVVEGYGNGLNKMVIEHASHPLKTPFELSSEVLPEVVAVSAQSHPGPAANSPELTRLWTLAESQEPPLRPRTATGLVRRQERYDISGFSPLSSTSRSGQSYARPRSADRGWTRPYAFEPHRDWNSRPIISRPQSAAGRTTYPFSPDMILPSSSDIRADWMLPFPASVQDRRSVTSLQTINDLSSQSRRRPPSTCHLRRSNATLERGNSGRTVSSSPVSPVSPVSPLTPLPPLYFERDFSVQVRPPLRRTSTAPPEPPLLAPRSSMAAYKPYKYDDKQLPPLPEKNEARAARQMRKPKKRLSLPIHVTSGRPNVRTASNSSTQKRRKSVSFAPATDVLYS